MEHIQQCYWRQVNDYQHFTDMVINNMDDVVNGFHHDFVNVWSNTVSKNLWFCDIWREERWSDVETNATSQITACFSAGTKSSIHTID